MKAVFGAILLGLAALPVAAQECFTGRPTKVAYDDGSVITIIQRHGDDLTFTKPQEGFQDQVNKSSMMLFPKAGRSGARATEYRWTTRLPKLGQMVPGFQFAVKGTMASNGGKPIPYGIAGDVVRQEVLQVGGCPYDVQVIDYAVSLGGQVISTATDYLSPDLLVVLRSEVVPASAGTQIVRNVVALE